MVGVLIRMKLTVLRRSFAGTQAANLTSGAVCGLALALGMIWLGSRGTAASADLLALALAGWAAGWITGPAIGGGGDPGVRREHLRLLPLGRRQVTVGLFGAALVGVGPAVTLVAFAALVCYGATLGLAAALIAVPAALLLLVGLVALARLVVATLGALLSSRASAALAALPWAVLTAVMGQCWVVFVAVDGDQNPLADGLPGGLATVLRALPSGWPVVAVEAADRGDWLLALGALAGLAALTGLALVLWTRLLERPAPVTVTRPTGAAQPALDRSGAARLAGTPGRSGGVLGAVVGKELRTWSRDLVRIHFLTFALAYGLVFALFPAPFGLTEFLPFTGVIVALMIASCSAHLYSSDGTALWLTLMMPGVARADVRGRQLAWLLTAGPVAIGLTLIGLLGSGHWWAAPWLAALVPAVLGAGAGLVVLVSVFVPVRMPDPHRRGNNPGQDAGPISGLIWLMLGLLAAAATPSFAITMTGAITGNGALLWAGAPVGLATGVLLAWGLGRVAHRRLATRGPELLHRIGTA